MYFYYINQTTSIIYTLSLHDALPIFVQRRKFTLKNRLHISLCISRDLALCQIKTESGQRCYDEHHGGKQSGAKARYARSEEHTSELQSPDHLVCRLLLEKKNLIYNFP